jgi:hypothetical protein
MSFREFTIKDVKGKLGLTLVEDEPLHVDVPPVQPGLPLREWLQRYAPLALDINTEKARSELIIAPVLLEARRLLHERVGYFSGRELSVDTSLGLTGVCDFLLSMSPERFTLTAPLLVVVEAKNLDIVSGIPQCLAEMVAMQIYNRQEGSEMPVLHGVVTTGSNWRFLRLVGHAAWIDVREHYLDDVGQTLGILCHVLEEGLSQRAQPPVPSSTA